MLTVAGCKVESVLGTARRRGDAGGIVERAATQIQRVLGASAAPSTNAQGVVIAIIDEVEMAAPKHLLFPVETINRELDYRLALAVMAARQDNRIYIGLHETLMRVARRLRGGVYLGKNAIRPHASDALDDYHRLKERGFVFVHLDTEGAVYPGDAARWRKILYQRLDPRHLDSEDYVCTWGDFQREAYRELQPPCAANIRTTGHPRFDLYRPRWRSFYGDKAQKLRQRFGDFVLVNTNFTHANNKMGTDFVFSPINGFDSADLESRLDTVRDWAYMNAQLSHFVRLVHRLQGEFPTLAIVVRPHPTESPDFYQRAFRDLSSVHVLHEGPVGPWLLACQCMIHDGCTTGVEAHLSQARIINYRGVDDSTRDFFLPNLFGVQCTSEDAVVAHLSDLLGQRHTEFASHKINDVDPRAQRLLNNFCAESFPMMLEILDEAQNKVRRTDGPPAFALHGEESLYETLEGAKNLLRPLSARHRHAAEYSRNKFPGLDSNDIKQRLQRLQRIADRRVTFRVVSRGLMVVESPND